MTYFPNELELESYEEDFFNIKNSVIYHIIKYSEYVLSYSYLSLSGKLSTFRTYRDFYIHYITQRQ